ncbi:E3 ubiquitin-protein ligase Os04g0590900-like [Curcuma longa]|uniref:E3 ubiquitin-protein ligase Os04g0590900-like n=1 Tax=Curcuma longa TaxID=136217 RepID=UPI003D9F93B5
MPTTHRLACKFAVEGAALFLVLAATTMASDGVRGSPSWVAYEPNKEAPPPPPLEGSDGGGGRTFTPLVVAVVAVLVGAFLLVSYYTIVTKYCGTFHSPWWRSDHELYEYDDRWREERWDFSSSDGLEEASIAKIPVRVYSPSGDGTVGAADCLVCLGEFREAERLRLLPVCGHAFHLRCIDAWLKARGNCPLCRANAVSDAPQQGEPVDAHGDEAAIFVGGDELRVMKRSMSMEVAREQRTMSSVSLNRSFSVGRFKGGNWTLPL